MRLPSSHLAVQEPVLDGMETNKPTIAGMTMRQVLAHSVFGNLLRAFSQSNAHIYGAERDCICFLDELNANPTETAAAVLAKCSKHLYAMYLEDIKSQEQLADSSSSSVRAIKAYCTALLSASTILYAFAQVNREFYLACFCDKDLHLMDAFTAHFSREPANLPHTLVSALDLDMLYYLKFCIAVSAHQRTENFPPAAKLQLREYIHRTFVQDGAKWQLQMFVHDADYPLSEARIECLQLLTLGPDALALAREMLPPAPFAGF